MPGRIVPKDRPPVVLTPAEWDEIADCSSALFASLRFYEEHEDEAWEIVKSVEQRFQRAISPVEQRLTEQHFGESED